MTRSRQILIGVATLVAVQTLLFVAYRVLHSRPVAVAEQPDFDYEAKLGPVAAPDVLLERSDGTTFRFPGSQEQAVLLHFWATWCEPCREELPLLLEWSQSSRAESGQVVLVSVDENWAAVRHFFDENVPALVVRERKGELRKAYRVSTLPVTYVLRSGTVVARMQGARNWDSDTARQVLADLFRR
jgi:thiol-disulfide isomerase/thioredoxin